MRKESVRIAACTMAAVITFSGMKISVQAAGDLNSVLPSAGIEYSLSSESTTSLSDMKEEIERRGGKVTGSVTGKTVCLINNDTTSQSSKNKKAKELGVKILSEEDFMAEYLK